MKLFNFVLEYLKKRILNAELPGRRSRGRPDRRYLNSLMDGILSRGFNWEKGTIGLVWFKIRRSGLSTATELNVS